MNKDSNRKPEKEEFAEYYGGYIDLVEGGLLEALESQLKESMRIFRAIPESKADFRYEAGKWSIKEVIGHLIDTERVMAFRALSFARGDTSEIAGMDQDQYVSEAAYDQCEFETLLNEFESLRKANLLFFSALPQEAWSRSGIASGNNVSVRALAYIIAGHEIHHRNVIEERYLVSDSAAA
ncbi:MAG: DinB family protein [Pyrinomonadaceae bacterium]|nr:DinB family protein [Pyrinomonadaceae bacterium]